MEDTIILWTLGGFGLVVTALAFLALLSAMRPAQISGNGYPLQMRVAGRRYGLHYSAGSVVGAGRSTETHHVSGSETRDETGRVLSSTPGYSYDVVKDTLLLQGADGRERPVRLTNWHVAARPGHRMAVVFPIRAGQDSGHYVLVHNADTGENLWDDAVLRRVLGFPLGPRFAIVLGVGLVGAALALDQDRESSSAARDVWNATWLVLLGIFLVTTVLGKVVARSRVRSFKRHVAPQVLAQALPVVTKSGS